MERGGDVIKKAIDLAIMGVKEELESVEPGTETEQYHEGYKQALKDTIKNLETLKRMTGG